MIKGTLPTERSKMVEFDGKLGSVYYHLRDDGVHEYMVKIKGATVYIQDKGTDTRMDKKLGRVTTTKLTTAQRNKRVLERFKTCAG